MLNQCILVGRVSKIRKTKGVVKQFHLDITRVGEPDVIDSPIIKVNEEFAKTLTEYFRPDMVVGVKARIQTEVKGGYGTVMSIVAEKLTFINTAKLDEE